MVITFITKRRLNFTLTLTFFSVTNFVVVLDFLFTFSPCLKKIIVAIPNLTTDRSVAVVLVCISLLTSFT